MPWRQPNYEGEFPSLGWDIVDWIHSLELEVPAGTHVGQTLQLRPSQIAWFVWFYRLDPTTGKRSYRRGQNVGPKGSGKSPEGGLTCLAEAYGPTKFDGWDSHGEPVGTTRQDAVVNIVGTSEDQTGNMYDWLFSALNGSQAAAEHGWTVELGRVTSRKGGYGVIEAITSSALSATGSPQTFVAMEETWLWFRSNGGHRLARALIANATKTGGTVAEFTNPPELGRDSIAELTQRTAHKQPNIYVRSRQADLPKPIAAKGLKLASNRKHVMAAIKSAYGDTLEPDGWIDADNIYDGIADEATPEDEAYRLYLGVARKSSTMLIDPEHLDIHTDTERVIEHGARIVLSFDGATTTDSTVILATSIEEQPHQWVIGWWERPRNIEEWRVPHDEVNNAMRQAAETWRVDLLAADYAGGWEAQINDWEAEWGTVTPSKVGTFGSGRVLQVWWNNNPKIVDDMTRTYTAVIEASTPDQPLWTHSGDPRLRAHILNMTRAGNRSYVRPGRRDQTPDSQIDGGVASILGLWAARYLQNTRTIKQSHKDPDKKRAAFARLANA